MKNTAQRKTAPTAEKSNRDGWWMEWLCGDTVHGGRAVGAAAYCSSFYSALYPTAPKSLKKAAMFLSSGDPDMYDGAKFSYEGDFLGYLGLEGCGIFTNHDMDVMDRIRKMASSL